MANGDRLQTLMEGERRGMLNRRQQAILDEARRRDLIPPQGDPRRQTPQMSGPQGGQPTAQAEDPGFNRTLARETGRRFTSNLLETPSMVGEQLQRAGQSSPQIPESPLPRPPGVDMAARAVGSGLSSVGEMLPSATDVFAGGQMAGEAVSGLLGDGDVSSFQEARQQQQQEFQRGAEEQPGANVLGGLLGDAATIFTGRAPVAAARGARNMRRMEDEVGQEALQKAKQALTLGRTFKKAVTSKPIRRMAEGLGNVGEAGIEGAVLAQLNNQDPATSAGYAAGAQAAGSTLLSMTPRTLGNWGKLALATGGLIAATRLAQQAAPGWEENWFTAGDTVMSKMMLGLAGGVSAGIAGMGRVKPGQADEIMSVVTEGLTSIPRGATQSAMREFFGAPRNQTREAETALRIMAEDPGSLTKQQREMIGKSIQEEDESIIATVRELAETNEAFRNRLTEAMRQPEEEEQQEPQGDPRRQAPAGIGPQGGAGAQSGNQGAGPRGLLSP